MDNEIDLYDECIKLGENYQVVKYLMVTKNKVDLYNNIVVSVSGGSDSDTMIDMFTRCDPERKIRYIFFDTGLEYDATKRHLDDLEEKYNIKIERLSAKMPIPTSCKKYGQPFINKFVSDMMGRLQSHNFKWEDESFDVLYKRYPHCKGALSWWCNENGENSRFNIDWNKGLKDFVIKNNPWFLISNKCCKYAKKNVAKDFIKKANIDLNVTGVRKSEGGIRATSYKNCFDLNDNTYDNYRPLFFFNDEDKKYYKDFFDLTYSDCYEVWGMKRTGCVGCPYGRNLEQELDLCEKYEPKLAKAVKNVFKDSYKYTEMYHEFVKNNYCKKTL